MIYTKRQTVYASRTGSDTHLSLIGAVQIVQDSICEYFEMLGIDEITMKTKHNTLWMFTRNSVLFKERLAWNDDFVARCAITERTPLKLVVDTTLSKDNGTICVQSKTEICMVDLSQMKLRRIDGTFLSEDYHVDSPLCNMEFIRPTLAGQGRFISKIVAPSTSIDYCGHVNNVEYIRFLLNTYSSEELKKGIKRFDISYISQGLENDTLDVYSHLEDNAHTFEIRRDDSVLTKCRIEFDG